MDTLKELARIVTLGRPKRIELLPRTSENQCGALLSLIEKGIADSDQVAATKLYGSSTADLRYRATKSRLKKRLINTLFFLDLKEAGFAEHTRMLDSEFQ